ncbi:uveal autoantigen with coiled-coil domains and ankyrin repeats [Cylas formicarius]|uniref:uveal autoantigen with coiled-coil domains and ankyrin repeats n=1 Tax=Cylas formicarius TaxID=197179 RepID=UPI0029583666|nr:uveal autoantigen with coiled-coil domains and ankyrin repeats [Cylas formicarius]
MKKLADKFKCQKEGQRKALFEDCEAERKSNADDIIRLKKEISNLTVVSHQTKSPVAEYRLKDKRIEEVVGPLADKSCFQVKELLDLHVINTGKRLDLLKYRMDKRRKYIDELGNQYQNLLGRREKKELIQKVEKPAKKHVSELQTNIHAVEVQIREAAHIRNRYRDIRTSLKRDAARFESSTSALEGELANQNRDVDKLQKILVEATRRKARARNNLIKEEKAASAAAQRRELEAAEGRRLVAAGRSELEELEKRMFQGGKPPPRPAPEGAEADPDEGDKSATPPHPVEARAQQFELLKRVTGGTTADEVLERFKSQKETQARLDSLRQKSENEKSKIEKNLETLKSKLEAFRYSEVKEAERKSGEMERLQTEISQEQSRSVRFREQRISKERVLADILESLQSLRLCVNPVAVPETNPEVFVDHLVRDVEVMLAKHQSAVEKEEKIEETPNKVVELGEERLPGPYSTLLRKTPVTQTSGSPAPPPTPVSEDEEEVPSRGYLKRQAQMVIDAKSRRKNIRIQLPKRD